MKNKPNTPAKKSTKKATTTAKTEWKADFGEGKPASVLYTISDRVEKSEGSDIYKAAGTKLSDLSKILAKDHELTGENDVKVVTAMLRAEFGDGTNKMEDIIPHNKFAVLIPEIRKLTKIDSEMKEEAAKKTVEADRKKKEMEASARQAGEKAIVAVESKLAKIAKQTTDLIRDKVSGIKGVKALENGRFELSPSITDEEVAEGFSTISGMVGTAESLKEGFAMAEARFAQAIDMVGKNWKLFFNPDQEDQKKSMVRIRQAIGALNKMDKYEIDLPKASLTTIRTIMEAKYNKDDEKDNAARLNKVVSVCKEYYEENDRYPPANALRNIVAEYKKEGGSKRHNWIYIVTVVDDKIHVVGTEEKSSSLAAIAAVTIHVGSMSHLMHDDNGVLMDPCKIEHPDKALLELAEASAPEESADGGEEEVEGIEWDEGEEGEEQEEDDTEEEAEELEEDEEVEGEEEDDDDWE